MLLAFQRDLPQCFLNAFNVSCSGTDVCASLWLCELGWKQLMMLVFDAQNSGCRSLKSSFPPLEHMVCVVSAHQSKEAFKHVLIDGRGRKQVPRVDVCKAELCAFPSCLLTLPRSGSQPCKYTHQPKSVLQATSLPNLPKIYVPKSHLSVLNKGCL